eukprot:1545013-Lingulodinium_polyedra.AAC.1
MLAQNKLEKRLHSKLDHTSPATKALPERQQYEYKWVTDKEPERLMTVDAIVHGVETSGAGAGSSTGASSARDQEHQERMNKIKK